MLYLLGTSSLPKISLTEKSILQPFLDPDEISCDAGLLTSADLSAMDFSRRDDCDVTFLMMACEFGRLNAVQMLLQCGVDMNAVDKWGHSALHYACGCGFADCIEELLVNGAHWRIRGCKELGALTPPEMAVSRGFGGVWERAYKRALRQIARTVRAKRREKRQQSVGDEVLSRIEMLSHMADKEVQITKQDDVFQRIEDCREVSPSLRIGAYLCLFQAKDLIIILLALAVATLLSEVLRHSV